MGRDQNNNDDDSGSKHGQEDNTDAAYTPAS